MLGLAQFERAAFFGAWIDQLFWLKNVSAIVALVRARAFVAADIACPFHITVGQKALCGRGVPLHGLVGIQKTVLFQRQENGLRNLEMILGMCCCKQVVRDAISLEKIHESIVIFLIDFLNGFAFLIR